MASIKQYKIARRLGVALFEKCQNPKFNLVKGDKKRRPRVSDYGQQLLEKQKVRFLYGIGERQFVKYIKESLTSGGESTPANQLFTRLETRLDNIIYRLGLAKTRRMARQMVAHGHFAVNGRRTKVPSYKIQSTDVISIRPGSESTTMIVDALELQKERPVPAWLNWDNQKKEGKVIGIPTEPESFLDFQTVIEFYSR